MLVKDVEEFRSELNLKSLSDLRVFDNREINVAKFIGTKGVAAQITRICLCYRAVGPGDRGDPEELLSKVESVIDHIRREELFLRPCPSGLKVGFWIRSGRVAVVP